MMTKRLMASGQDLRDNDGYSNDIPTQATASKMAIPYRSDISRGYFRVGINLGRLYFWMAYRCIGVSDRASRSAACLRPISRHRSQRGTSPPILGSLIGLAGIVRCNMRASFLPVLLCGLLSGIRARMQPYPEIDEIISIDKVDPETLAAIYEFKWRSQEAGLSRIEFETIMDVALRKIVEDENAAGRAQRVKDAVAPFNNAIPKNPDTHD
jgi:hypothetical protein